MPHDLNNEYLDWIFSLIGNTYDGKSYVKLLEYLHNCEFICLWEFDDSRAADGIEFRYRFGYENNYSRIDISTYLDTRPCSILEMMAALAFRCEESIMSNPKYGDRTSFWFWGMISSLGLLGMDDRNLDKQFVDDVIHTMLHHNYKKNGRGGLFTVHDPRIDMRRLNIWYQLNAYLNELDD